jgi:hypothetical protein
MKKEIIELWKWYFLAIAETPIFWGIVIGFSTLTFALIWDVDFLNNPSWETMPAAGFLLSVWLGPTIFFSVLNLLVVNKKITVFSPRVSQAVIIYASSNEPLTYRRPLWGKFDYKIFRFPKGFGASILKDDGYEQLMHLELEVQSRKVILPFRFKMIWQDTPDAWDFHEIAIWQGEEASGQKVFQLAECLQNIFVKENARTLKPFAEELIIHKSLDERQKAIETIKAIVHFPDNLLPAAITLTLLSKDIKMDMFGYKYSINLNLGF